MSIYEAYLLESAAAFEAKDYSRKFLTLFYGEERFMLHQFIVFNFVNQSRICIFFLTLLHSRWEKNTKDAHTHQYN